MTTDHTTFVDQLNIVLKKKAFREWCRQKTIDEKWAYRTEDGQETPIVRFIIEDNPFYYAEIEETDLIVFDPVHPERRKTFKMPKWALAVHYRALTCKKWKFRDVVVFIS